MASLNSLLTTLPNELYVSKLPNGEKEFFCFICFPNMGKEEAESVSWKITSTANISISVNGEREITNKELEQHKFSISAILPSEFNEGELMVKLASYECSWRIQSYDQKRKFRLPLDGQVLIVAGHRLGDAHRSAQIASQHFGWDLLPLHNDGLRLLKRSLTKNLATKDFEGFGQPVLAPGNGIVVKAVDGNTDLTNVGELPTNLDYYRDDITRALGNYVIIDHGEDVWSFLAHLKYGSVKVKAGQDVKALDKLGELGNSGFSSGPHCHLHFMNGSNVLTASPLPIELDLEGGTYAPQAGEITSSQ